MALLRFLKSIRKWMVSLIVAGVLIGAVLLAALWIEHNQPLDLPAPTGPFAVGRISATWTDPQRIDPLAPAPGQPRTLAVWIWYPARRTPGMTPALYYPPVWANALADQTGFILTQFLNRNPNAIHTHSFSDTDLAPDQSTYPVIILRSGIGAQTLDYTTLAEDLASHGYIVVGADAPYSTTVVVLPDGRVVHRTQAGHPTDTSLPAAEIQRLAEQLVGVWTADTKFLVDQLELLNTTDPTGRFTGRLDLAAIGVAGHSFGGATAAQFCSQDARCRAGIDIDGAPFGSVIQSGLKQPFLFLLSDHGEEWTSPACTICADIRAVATRIPGDRLIITLRGSNHFSFSDQVLVKSQIVMDALVATGISGLDGRTGLADTRQYIRTFFDITLRGASRGTFYQTPLISAARFERQ
jgi:predicted dienelactone hydrolase